MMGHRGKLIDGGEYDALTIRSKRHHNFKAGTRAWIKRKFNKRMRRDHGDGGSAGVKHTD